MHSLFFKSLAKHGLIIFFGLTAFICFYSHAQPPLAAPKIVGISYSTWFGGPNYFNSTPIWDSPRDGGYISSDSTAISRHAFQMKYAGIDFAFVDWSNNILCQSNCEISRPDLYAIEQHTLPVFDTFEHLSSKPKLSIMLGTQSDDGADNIANGNLQRKINQVWNLFLDNPTQPNYKNLYQYWKGKPLLIVFIGVTGIKPNFNDDRFTIRWMSGYIDSQPGRLVSSNTGESNVWSYKDRTTPIAPTFSADPQIASIVVPEHVAVTASYPGQGGWIDSNGRATRNNAGSGEFGVADCGNGNGSTGQTLRRQWDRALNVDPEIVTIASFNEWVVGPDQKNVNCSTDIEPSAELGQTYLDVTKDAISAFRKYRSDIGLRDVNSGNLYFRNSPGFSFESQYTWAPGVNYQISIGDWNSDGYGDISLRDSNSGILYFKTGPDFSSNQTVYSWASGTNYQAFSGDFNGDAKWDIGLRDVSTGILYFKNGPDFSNNQSTYQWASGAGYQFFSGDFNGDGIWDIGLRDISNGTFYIKIGPDFSNNQMTYQWAPGAQYQAFAGDFNGDGVWDIALRDINSGIIYLKHGPGFSDQDSFQWAPGSNYSPFSVNLR